MNKEKKLNFIMLCVTGAAAVLFIVSLIVFLSSGAGKNQNEELQKTAGELLERNFNIAYYYEIASLSAKADFDPANYPEGVAPCNTDIFASASELTAYISNTFIPEEAGRIVGISVNGIPRYSQQNGELCMAVVSGDTTYPKDLSKASFHLENIQKKSADLVVSVPLFDGSGNASMTLNMVKQGDRWLLTHLVY